MNIKILIICTGNSCRSQMAEGFFHSFNDSLEVHSAGTHPAEKVNPNAVRVMKELGIDISGHQPEWVDKYINQEWDYVITVCDQAKETCPVFRGTVKNRFHIGFEDPANATGTEEEVITVYRKTRDEIGRRFKELYNEIMHNV